MDKRIVEIAGVKMEVDLRTAKTVEAYKVGDSVRVLVKGYGESYTAHSGIIVAFDDFQKLPTIVVAYVNTSYSEEPVKIVHINSKSEGHEIAPATDRERLLDEVRVRELLDRAIIAAENKLADVRAQQAYFEKWIALVK